LTSQKRIISYEHKNIIVVGCGTISGYLADMFAKAGAGAGMGELTLIDSDALHASNLGRHRLGFQHINKKKSDALALELRTGMPDAKIRSLPVDFHCANIFKADLISDATGEQTVSDFLASAYTAKNQLCVCIEGLGIAVPALIRRGSHEACIQCLTRLTRAGGYASTVECMPKVCAGYGCENEYVPFPASVSIQAACLAFEMVMDWAAGSDSPALRTRVVDRNFTANSEYCSLPKFGDCPACHT
jgi:molybdopterin/thiamine biosynthesis adenylyltransferase